MKTLMRVFGVAATWAFIYALPALPIEGLANVGIDFSFTHAVDMWPLELGLPGFVGGVAFSVLLALSGSLSRFESMPLGRLAGLGAVAGVLLGGFYLGTVWPATSPEIALIFGLAIGLGALAGPGSSLVFRALARRRTAVGARAGA